MPWANKALMLGECSWGERIDFPVPKCYLAGRGLSEMGVVELEAVRVPSFKDSTSA
jgi:hypothetical protein